MINKIIVVYSIPAVLPTLACHWLHDWLEVIHKCSWDDVYIPL